MAKVTQLVFESLKNFELVWRWTNEKYRKFTKKELENIRPIEKQFAAQIYNNYSILYDKQNHSLNPKYLRNLKTCESGPDDTLNKNWIKALLLENEKVICSWDSDTAVLSTLNFVIENLDDFFYPGSDDLTIIPLSNRWILDINHDGMETFAIISTSLNTIFKG